MGYSYTIKYPTSADVAAVATQLAQRQSDVGTTNGGITASGGSSAVPQLGVDAAGLGAAYLQATADSLMCAVGYQGQDQQAWVTSGTTNVTAGSWNLYGPTYTFSAPIAKTYVVNFRCNAYLSAATGGLYSLYVRIRNTTTSTSYNAYPQFWTAVNAGGSQSYVNACSEAAVVMVAGNNVLQFELLGDAGTTWQLTTGTYRSFLVRG